MPKRLEIWHTSLILWFILLIFRNELIISLFTRLTANPLSNLKIEILSELVFFFLFPIIMFLFRRVPILRERIKYYNFIGLLLLVMFLFPAIISEKDPDFRKDLSVTKLLPPLTTVNVLYLKDQTNMLSDENIIFTDSVRYERSWVYFQKQASFEVIQSRIKFREGRPLVTTKTFLLGTDILGRDVFSRLVYGVRTSLLIGLCAALISFITGITAGFTAGYYEGAAGIIFSRTVDVLLSFPVIILIILIVALFGNSLTALVLILGLTGWMGLFKIVRSEVTVLKTKDFFITSKLIGLSSTQLIIKDAFPVFIVPALTNLIFQINNVIIAESSLSYLGLGVGNIYPSWGAMIQSGQEYIESAWWLILFPGLMIVLTLQSIKGFGNAINSYFNPGIVND